MKKLLCIIISICCPFSFVFCPLFAQMDKGMVQYVWYSSNAEDVVLGVQPESRRMAIYLPPSYFTSDAYYPVLYLLHGSGDDETGWLEKGQAAFILDEAIKSGKAKEMIVVMPNGNLRQSAACSYAGIPFVEPDEALRISGLFEQNFSDIITYVERNYRTITKKHSRAIAGLSMGGYHAMHISHYLNQMFDYVGLFSGVFSTCTIDERKMDEHKFCLDSDQSSPRVYRNITKDLKRQFAPAPKLYWIGCGTDDFLYQENINYCSYLDSLGLKYEYHESDGGHEWKNWRNYLQIFVERLFK